MALDSDIIELAFSIQLWRLKLGSFTYCSVYYRTLGYFLTLEANEPRISLSIAAMFGLLLLVEGIHPNPGPISENELPDSLTRTFKRILGGSHRAESPSLVSFQNCLAQVSRDEQTTRTPGDGMNTPPPEPQTTDRTTDYGTRTTRNSAADDDGYPRATSCDVTSVDTPFAPSEDHDNQYSNDDDVRDCTVSSASAHSLSINEIMAEARLESRTASNMDDDFYNDSECSSAEESEDETSPGDGMNSPPPEPKTTDCTTDYGIRTTCNSAADVNGYPRATSCDVTSVDTPFAPPEDHDNQYNNKDDNDCTVSSTSAHSLSINEIMAEARLESRTASNMNDDFYINSECSSAVEAEDETRRDKSSKEEMGNADTDDDFVLPSVSGDSLDLNDIYAQARAKSRTATSMDDDFCRYETSSDEEDQDDTRFAAANTAENKKVMPGLYKTNKADAMHAADDNNCVLPSVSSDSLDLNDIYAQARAKSRAATSMDDDFYCNVTSSDEEDQEDTRYMAAITAENNLAEAKRMSALSNKTDAVCAPVGDGRDILSSVSSDSLDLNDIYAQARAKSRAATSMADDFYCNDTSSDEEDQEDTRHMAVNTATNRSVEALQMPALLNQTDADDNDCVSPSVSGDSLDLNDIYAQARAKSRTATSMDDDFYCNETSSDEEEEDETKEVTGARDRSPGWATTKRVTDEVGEMDASTEDNFVVPSVSDDSMDLKYILAQSRIESRTAANMDDDFYCSDTMSSDDDACNDSRMQIARTLTEGLSPETGDKYESPKISATPDSGDRPRRPSILHISNILDQTDCPVGTPIPRESTKAEDTDSESDDDVHVLPSIYGASMDIGFISAKARVDSGTAISKDDDFCCNESACSDEETHGSGRCGKKMNKSVTFASSETVMEDSGARKSSVNRTVAPCSHRTPSPVVPGSHRNPSPVVPGSKTFEAFDPSSLIDSTDDDKNTVNTVSTEQIDGHAKSASLISSVKFSKADRVVEGAEDDEKRPFKSKATYVDGERFKNLFERIIDRSSVIPSASKNAMDALKNCRTDTPFLFTNDDNVYIESDEEAGDNGVENAFMSLERISDTTEDTARETISTARKKENSDSEDELAFTVSAEDEYAETALQAFYPAEPTEITLQGKIKEINDRAYSRIRTPCPLLDLLREHGDFEDELAFAVSEDKYAETALQAFYPAEPTEITLQGKIKEINDRAYSRMRTPYPLLDLLKEHGNKSPTMNSSSNFVLNMEDTDEKEELKTFQSPPSLPVEKKNKKKKRKDQKRMKEELKTVNRLSPTPLFTTPILGPIKSGQNNSQREYKQTSSHKSPSIDSFSDGIVLNTEIIEEKEELGTFGWLQSLPVEKKNKKKKGKGQKRKKDELKTVNRLSPTPLFTTPVLGPIKSSQTNPQRANRRIICHKSPILESSSDGVVQENTEEKEELGTFGWLQSLPVEKRNKKKKGKGQKRKKDELKTVNRLSPTPLFTTPVLGPIKSSQTNPQMANIQTSCHKPPSLVSSSDGFVLNTKHTEEKEELGTFEWLQSYSQPVEKNKKKKRKGQKRKKDELKTVIRLSPTPLFTTPVLGPIKSGQNNSQRANRQTSRYMGTTDNAETPIQIGKPIAAKVHEQEETILQNVMSKLGDNNEHIRQHHGEEVTTPVPGCLHTRSLTVAKFRAQFNRACILLPEIEEKQYNVQPGVGDHLLETINKRDKHRQEKLMEFKANIDKLNRKAISLFGRQNENEGKGSNSIVLYMGTTENDETPIQIGKPVAAEVYEKEETILQNAMSKLGDNNEHTRQHHGEEETTPVPGCLHTRSLTVAKFRAQFNRACILLPEIEEIQYNVQPEVGDHLLETINKRDKHRQEKLTEFKANIETLNRKTISLLGRQNENEEKGSNSIVLYMGTTDNDETPIQIGKPLGAKVCEKEETILQNVMSKLGDNNEHIRHIHTEEETTPVSECLQTRSLTVAKFRTQLNRTCIFLPEIGEKQYNVQPGVGDHLLETTNERDKHRQEKLLEFKANIEKINRKTISLLGRQNENEGKGSNSKEDHTESGNQRCQESHELKAFKEVPSEQKQVASGTYTNKNQIEFTPHAPSGPKPSFVRRRRRFKQLSADQQQALKSKIENNEILVPRAPSGRKSN